MFQSSARARVTGKLEGAGLWFAILVGVVGVGLGLALHIFLAMHLESLGYDVR